MTNRINNHVGKLSLCANKQQFIRRFKDLDKQNLFRMNNISESPIVYEDGFKITVNDILRKDDDESDNDPLFLTDLSISANKKQQNILKSSISSKWKLDNRPLERPPPKVRTLIENTVIQNCS